MNATMAGSAGDSTDPEDTFYPRKAPISSNSHTFKPLIVVKRLYKLQLPPETKPDNSYGIFALFFSDEILITIANHTNAYASI